ncbi:alpha/beta hydrolase [Paenibacillus chondroitinus]|uniref:Alpha/beta hydrolase n=1 Tax=Paenibacillus chondroitinus TaxID=59842 RepID=A0ABU6DA49_9BACL|nr:MULTISPECIES: alpha/beta hydrolase [Paenibacillus]MCY9662340.1 alpha/beta hydrolase [Paenibacillus anseongense]MEB4794620.1 alpha/beta hydrolase [Paenibacillus chondroitinus]
MSNMVTNHPHPLTLGMHVIEIDGVKQVYHVAGTGNGPVCIVHSGGPGMNWKSTEMPLLEQTMTMVYLEPVGTGNSGFLPDTDYSMPRYAYFAHKVVEHLGTGLRPYFIGQSHGGFVGLQYALDYPDELGGLILFSTAPLMNSELFEEMLRGLEKFVERYPDKPEAADTIPAFKAFMDGSIKDKETYMATLDLLLPAYFGNYWNLPPGLEEWKATVDFTMTERADSPFDVRDVLDTILTRTLILVGEYDFCTGPRWAKEMAEKIPSSQIHTFEKGGHMSHFEHAQEFMNVVNDFVFLEIKK